MHHVPLHALLQAADISPELAPVRASRLARLLEPDCQSSSPLTLAADLLAAQPNWCCPNEFFTALAAEESDEETEETHPSPASHCAFCALCCTQEDLILCSRCPLAFHERCIRALPHLVPCLSSNGDLVRKRSTKTRRCTSVASAGFLCPKCCGFPMAEKPVPLPFAYRRPKFAFRRWLATTMAPGQKLFSVSLQREVDVAEAVSAARSNASQQKKKRVSKSAKTAGRVLLADVSDFCGLQLFADCLAHLAKGALSRANTFIFQLVKFTAQSKADEDQQNFLDFGASVAWLLGALQKTTLQAFPEVAAECKEAAGLALTRWIQRTTRLLSSGTCDADFEALGLSMFEGCAAESMLHTEEMGSELQQHLDSVNLWDSFGPVISGDLTVLLQKEVACPACHEKVQEGSRRCVVCDFTLPTPVEAVQFGQITEAIVWLYLARKTGKFEIPSEWLPSLARQVVRCRPYRSSHELGWKEFEQQLYLITHTCLVCSDWGRIPLSQTLMAEEFLMLKSSIIVCVSNDEAELVGEMLFCLWLFDVDIWQAGGWAAHAVRHAAAYLLERERRFGGTGRYTSLHEAFYEHFHTSFCAMLGLAAMQRRQKFELDEDAQYFVELQKQFAVIPSPDTLLKLKCERGVNAPSYDLLSRLPLHERKKPTELYPMLRASAPVKRKIYVNRRLIPPALVTADIESLGDSFLLPLDNQRDTSERDVVTVRIVTIGNERSIPLVDIAEALLLPEVMCSRLVSRVTAKPPAALVCGEDVHSGALLLSMHPLTLQQVESIEVPSEDESRRVWLGGPLIVESADDEIYSAIVLHSKILYAMLAASEAGTTEECLLVDTGVFRQLLASIYEGATKQIQPPPVKAKVPKVIKQTDEEPVTQQQAPTVNRNTWSSGDENTEVRTLDRSGRATRRSQAAAAAAEAKSKMVDSIYEKPKGLDFELSSASSTAAFLSDGEMSAISSSDPLAASHAAWEAVVAEAAAMADEDDDMSDNNAV